MVSKPMPILPSLTLPPAWLAVLGPLRPALARSGTFRLSVVLATGLIARTGRPGLTWWGCLPGRASPR